MKWARHAGILILVLAVSGCWGRKSARPQPARTSVASAGAAAGQPGRTNLVITPDNALIGQVSFVNTAARFVVLTFPLGRMATVGQQMSVYRSGLKVGEVKVSGPQNNDNIVADLTAGDARVGDEARDR